MAIIDKDSASQMDPSVDTIISLEESGDAEQENQQLSSLITMVNEKFNRSKYKRQQDETRWIEAYQNYRGFYNSDVQFSDEEKSRVFIKVTKTKVLAAYAQVIDVLFSGNKFPIGVDPSPVANGDLPETVHFETAEGPPEEQLSSTVSRPVLMGLIKTRLEGVEDKLKDGPGLTATSATYEPVLMAAKRMEKKIHDQLEESDASKHLRFFTTELCLFGTGVMKGPFAFDKEYPKWSDTGEYTPKFETIPKVSAVSIWNFYPDADAINMEECEYAIERHKMSRSQLKLLKRRPHFRKDSIDIAIAYGPNYHPEYWESILEDSNTTGTIERFEVLEYWGMIDRETAEENDLEIPKELDDIDEFQVNIWICNDQILRLVFNPFTPAYIPYYATPYEMNPYSFFGIGVAENMADTQMLMNGFMRMAVDNAAVSGNIILEVDETNLVPGQNMKLFPGKIFRRQGGAPGQSIFATKYPNVSNELMQLYDKARQLTDESTGMPSYAHGGTGVAGMGRTASGMSMLMGAAAHNIKAVVKNIDDYLLSAMGKNMFAFNMQFNFDKDITGDLAIVARGTDALMRNEIRSQRLLQFLQTGMQNPATAPLIKADYILRELATSLELDEEKVVNDPREAMKQALLMREYSKAQGIDPNQGKPQQPGGPGQSVSDPGGNGGGNIAPGNAPEPTADGFTGGGARPGVNGQAPQ